MGAEGYASAQERPHHYGSCAALRNIALGVMMKILEKDV
jgi:hypothetical protein